MSAIALAIGGGAALAAGGSIFSGIMGSSGAKAQAGAIRDAANIASQTAITLDDKARGDLAPFRQMGIDAGDLVSQIMSGKVNLDDVLSNNSLFKWEQSQGERSLNRKLSSLGLYGSGSGLESLARFNSQLTGEFGQMYLDRLLNIQTMGANAAARMATNTNQTGQTLAGTTTQAGIAQGGAIANQYNSIGDIGTGVANAGASGLSTYGQYSLYKPVLDRLAAGSGGGGVSQYGPYNSGYRAPSFALTAE